MKMILMPLAVICMIGASPIVNAQIALHKNNNAAYAYNIEVLTSTNEAVNENSVSPLAIKDFKKRFAAVENEKWVQTTDGYYIANYFNNAVENRVVYDKKGRWSYSILDYNGDKLQKDLKNALSFDHEGIITRVSEIHTREKVIYLIRMTNNGTFKTIRVCDGDMEVIEELRAK